MDEQHDIEGTAATNGSNGHGSLSPVLAATEARAIEPAAQPGLPAPVVAAAGGAVVGAVAFLLLRVLRRPARQRGQVRIGRRRGRRGALEITGSRSFLVDVHMLKR
jgi:peptidoglycan/LPS O-acetylase OafA/YrhL